MKKKIILIFIICLFDYTAFAQTLISGHIIDKNSKKGIPYASILYIDSDSQKGGYTDSLGLYEFKLSNSIIQISSIGYKPLSFKISSLANNFTINLEPVNYILDAVEIKPNKIKLAKTLQMGYFKNKVYNVSLLKLGGLSPNNTLNYVAQFIKNNKKNTTLYVTKLLFNLSNHPLPILVEKGVYPGNCEPTLLRAHLFMVDESTKLPTKELLIQNTVFQNDCNTDNLIIDISNQNIIMPKNGLFIALEFIDIQRTKSRRYFPYIVHTTGKKTNDIYGSFHQEKWIEFFHTIGRPVQFGIEVIR